MTTKPLPLVSIIIPCYNQGKYIIECLESVKAQTYMNWECIVMDDGSSDNTKIVVQNYIQTESRISYNYQQNMGVSFARNNAIKLSNGKYILPLDGDDKIGSTYLEKALDILENNDKITVVYCEAELFGNKSGKWHLPNYSFDVLLKQNVLFCSTLFRRADFERTGGFDCLMKIGLEDWEFWISLLKNGGQVVKLDETLFYYRLVSNSRNSSFDKQKEREIRNYIYQKHKSTYDTFIPVSDLIYDNHLLALENKLLANSWDYRLGKMLLLPIRFLKRFILKSN